MSYKRTSPQPVVEGGTGAQTLTANGVLLGSGTSAITATAVGTTGQVLTGNTGSAPTFQSPAASSITITGDSGGGLTGNSFTFTGGTTGLTFAGASTTETLGGTLVVSNGGTGIGTTTAYAPICGGTTATGVFQAASSGMSNSGYVLTSNGSSALPSWQPASGGGLTWSVITGDQTAAVDSGYICNKGSTLLLTLPGTAAVGATIRVTGINTALGWRLVQGSGQSIYFGSIVTTTGASGYLQSSAVRDSVEIVCVVANTTWNVVSSVGNITYV